MTKKKCYRRTGLAVVSDVVDVVPLAVEVADECDGHSVLSARAVARPHVVARLAWLPVRV